MKRLLTTIAIALLFSLQQSIAATPDGKVTTYYDNGSKKADKHYKGGIPVGDWKSWHTNGRSYTSMSFLGDTGQIENIQVLFPDGALRYKGETIKGNAQKADKECKRVWSSKGNGSNWYDNYYLVVYNYHQDGTCEKAEKGNMIRTISSTYMTITDDTTGNKYDFPWWELTGTIPAFLREKSE